MTRAYHEDAESCALWQWAQHVPELEEFLFHVPNGGRRNSREAARLKRMGVRPGVSDYHLPIPRGGFAGLWIELKAPRPHSSSVSKEQKEWINKMRRLGAAAYVCRGWMEAKAVIDWYMDLPDCSERAECPALTEILGAADLP